MQRANDAPGFTAVLPDATGGQLLLKYPNESRETGMRILGYLSDALEIAQRLRLLDAPFVSITADGSTDKGKLHNLVIDVMYWDISIGLVSNMTVGTRPWSTLQVSKTYAGRY